MSTIRPTAIVALMAGFAIAGFAWMCVYMPATQSMEMYADMILAFVVVVHGVAIVATVVPPAIVVVVGHRWLRRRRAIILGAVTLPACLYCTATILAEGPDVEMVTGPALVMIGAVFVPVLGTFLLPTRQAANDG